MKKLFIMCILYLSLATPGLARDFLVDFIEENYKETQAQFSYTPLIYHSIQVNSSAGSKILILTGNDYNYRKWLRHYIAQDKQFIIKISDERLDEFISSKAFEIDVTLVHPFNGEKWAGQGDLQTPDPDIIKEDNHILIADPDKKRTGLIQAIAKRMGYQTLVFKTGRQALDSFKLQPEKFKMVITHHSIAQMAPDKLIQQILELNQTIPVIIDTGYKNKNIKKEFISKFAGFKSVHIKPVILRDLQTTIETLIKKNT